MSNNLEEVQKTTDAALPSVSTQAMIFAPDTLATMERFALMMSKGTVALPKHFQGKPADCLAVCMQAVQWGMNPFAVSQKTHVINGALGYEAQLVNAVITTQAPTQDRLHFEWYGPWEAFVRDTRKKTNELGCGVRVWATMKGEDEPRELSVEMNQATVRNSPLWQSDPKQQLAYLATKKWARLYCPDAILGVYTPDELREIPLEKDITPTSSLDDLLPTKEEKQVSAVDQTLVDISGADTLEDLEQIGKRIKTGSNDLQKRVRAEYLERKHALTPKKEHVDTETGEVVVDDNPVIDDAGPTLAEVSRTISAATTSVALDQACDFISLLPKKDQAAARKLAQVKRAELDASGFSKHMSRK